MSTDKRVMPSDEMLNWRRAFLARLGSKEPIRPQSTSSIGLSGGNKKLGSSGKLYKSMFVWNLPAVATCPGASRWCLSHCYNADDRELVFPIEKWAENWWMVLNEPLTLQEKVLAQIESSEAPSAVRIHSSGDFFSVDYIDFWLDVAKRAEDTAFWAYTRSWVIHDLLPALRHFNSLENVEVFASWDSTMPQKPPDSWRISYVYTEASAAEGRSRNDPRAFICPEQTGAVDCCASCGFCMRNIDKDVLFYFH